MEGRIFMGAGAGGNTRFHWGLVTLKGKVTVGWKFLCILRRGDGVGRWSEDLHGGRLIPDGVPRRARCELPEAPPEGKQPQQEAGRPLRPSGIPPRKRGKSPALHEKKSKPNG